MGGTIIGPSAMEPGVGIGGTMMGPAALEPGVGIGGTMMGPAAMEPGVGIGGTMMGPAAKAQVADAKSRMAKELRKLIGLDMDTTPLETLYRKGNPKVDRCIQLK
jgi:hypothetical protein